MQCCAHSPRVHSRSLRAFSMCMQQAQHCWLLCPRAAYVLKCHVLKCRELHSAWGLGSRSVQPQQSGLTLEVSLCLDAHAVALGAVSKHPSWPCTGRALRGSSSSAPWARRGVEQGHGVRTHNRGRIHKGWRHRHRFATVRCCWSACSMRALAGGYDRAIALVLGLCSVACEAPRSLKGSSQ